MARPSPGATPTLGQWVAGARPRTLPAAVSPVLAGTAIALWEARMAAARGIPLAAIQHGYRVSHRLLLDEVLAGLRPTEIEAALRLIDELRRAGLALLMVEHVVQAIAAVSDEVLVLHHGEALTRGPAAQVLADERVIEAYLGARYAAKNRSRS